MGGFIGKYIKVSGVAEDIHYKTKGVVEKEANEACKKRRSFTRSISDGDKAEEVFVTEAGNLHNSHNTRSYNAQTWHEHILRRCK